MKSSNTFTGLLEAFFTDRLIRQRQVSPHTIVSYRETFRQLLRFAQDRLKKPPYQMSLEDLDAPLIGTFLDHAEKVRGLSARSRKCQACRHSFILSLRCAAGDKAERPYTAGAGNAE